MPSQLASAIAIAEASDILRKKSYTTDNLLQQTLSLSEDVIILANFLLVDDNIHKEH